jgi:hypothetical protein
VSQHQDAVDEDALDQVALRQFLALRPELLDAQQVN